MSPESAFQLFNSCWWAGYGHGFGLGAVVSPIVIFGLLYYRSSIAQCARDELVKEAEASINAQVRAALGEDRDEKRPSGPVGFRKG